MKSAPVVAAILLLADPGLAFAPPRNQPQIAARDDSANDDIIRRVSTSAAGFFTGVGIMAQLAFADPSALQEGERQCLIIAGRPRRRAL